MTGKKNFHFKASTDFGAIVDGSVVSSSSERVGRELAKQGLLPLRIWSDRDGVPMKFAGRVRGLVRNLFGHKAVSSDVL